MTLGTSATIDRREQFRRVADEAIEIIKVTSEIIDELCRAQEVFQLYAEDHQHATDICESLLTKMRRLFYNRRSFTIDIGLRRFIILNLPIYEVSQVSGELHNQFRRMEIGSMTFLEGVNAKQLYRFVRLLGDAISKLKRREWLKTQMQSSAIDNISLSAPLVDDLPDDELSEISPTDIDQTSSVVQTAQKYRESQQITNPRKVYQIAVGIIRDIFNAGDRPDQINLRDVTRLAGNLAECLLNNAEAMTALAITDRIDHYQYTHPVNVAIFGGLIAWPLLRDTRQFIEFIRIALLYDVGKSRIPVEILTKHDKLTPNEINELQQHPIISADILDRHIELEKLAVLVAYEHHMHQKSSAYPAHDSTWEANLVTRIVCVAETFDALIANDLYRKTLHPHSAMIKLMQDYQGTPEASLLANLIETIGIFPCGLTVTLTSEEIGVVVRQKKGDILHPLIRIVTNRNGILFDDGPTRPTDSDCCIAQVIPTDKVPFDSLMWCPFIDLHSAKEKAPSPSA